MRLNKEKIEKLMTNKGIYCRGELAEKIGISRAYLSTKLNADYISPESKIIKKLMQIFELSDVNEIVY